MWAAGERHSGRLHPDAGFTLLEALVILAVLALAAGISFPAVDAALRYQSFMDGATRFEAALRGARGRALRRGVSVGFVVSSDQRGFGAGDVGDRLPDRVHATLSADAIIFYPDGTASGGEALVEDGVRARRWRVRPATGLIERIS